MKKYTWKKLLLTSMAVLTLGGLGACSSDSTSSTSTPAASTSGDSGAASSASTPEASTSGGDFEGTIEVGILHSQTGSMAISEQSVIDAELLAISEINATGGVLGHEIVALIEDGASEPSTFATKAEKLVDAEGVAVVFGCWTSSSRKAVLSTFESYDSLLFYPVQYEGMEQSPNVVYTGAAPNQQIVPAVEYLLEEGYTEFFLMGSDYVFPRTANMIITAQVEAAGGTVVGEEYAAMDQTDFSSIISKIETAQPQVILNTLNGTGNVSFFKQMSEKNYTSADFMTMSFSIAEEEVSAIGANLLEGHMVSWNYYQTTETAENTTFVEAYKSAYGDSRVTSDPAEAAYDAVYLWAAACEKAGSFEVADVLDAIGTGEISFQAPEGLVTIDGETQHLAKPVRIGEIREDGLIYEVYSTSSPVDPDPYLKGYDWAVEAGLQPYE